MLMRVRYETGVATLVQFAIGTILAILSGGASAIGGCIHQSGVDCATNTFVTLLLIILTAAILAALAIFGYTVQARRSPKLAYILIAVEVGAAVIYLFDAKQSPALIDRATNFLSFLVAAGVIWIAWQLARAKGGRIVKPQPRHRRVAKR